MTQYEKAQGGIFYISRQFISDAELQAQKKKAQERLDEINNAIEMSK